MCLAIITEILFKPEALADRAIFLCHYVNGIRTHKLYLEKGFLIPFSDLAHQLFWDTCDVDI